MRKKIIKYLPALFVSLSILFLLFYLSIGNMSQFGGNASGERLERIKNSSNYNGKKFRNSVKTESSWGILETGSFVQEWIFGQGKRVPENELPIKSLNRNIFSTKQDDGIKIIWLGHATVLIEIDGFILLTDPVWSDNPSFSSMVGARRFHKVPIELNELPKLDMVLISHDHYDHLDMETVMTLSQNGVMFIVPLGVGAHLEEWGIASSQISEFDWYDSLKLGGENLTLTATPARHASGRGLIYGSNPTLWCSWVIRSKTQRLFFSGDTGDFEEFDEIGKRFGPFDYTLMTIGAYSDRWPDIHLTPEQAVSVHKRLGGKVLVPIHWGTFNLAFHDWYEPAERFVKASELSNTSYLVPMPGEIISTNDSTKNSFWWREHVE